MLCIYFHNKGISNVNFERLIWIIGTYIILLGWNMLLGLADKTVAVDTIFSLSKPWLQLYITNSDNYTNFQFTIIITRPF